jgi:pimeloyl-ACP methyl ester carboxylesterase
MIASLAASLLTLVGGGTSHTTGPPLGVPVHPVPVIVAAHENVAVVLHGLDSTVAIFSSTEPGSGLIAQLTAQGWFVIVPEEPYDSIPSLIRPALADGGIAYRAAWGAEFASILVSNRVPANANLLVVGISWGGLHALLAACDNPAVSEVVVHDPVVEASSLAEFAGMSLPGLSVSSCAHRLAAMRGQMSYGTLDIRVGLGPSQQLAEAIASKSMSVIREVEGHQTTTADVTMMLRSTVTDFREVILKRRLP